MIMTNLNRATSYRNDAVVGRFAQKHNISEEKAQEIFEETCKWLWLKAKASQEASAPELPMFENGYLEKIDEMWHTFLLYTKDYTGFCHRLLGQYVHHTPSKGGDGDNPVELELMIEYVIDHLGVETARRWFSTPRGAK